MEVKGIQKQIVDFLKRSEHILIMPSSPLDGDSLGSALALYHILRKLNKEATVVCAEPVPELYKFLPTIQVISNQMFSSRELIITLDCRKIKVDTIKSNLETDKVNIIVTPQSGGFSEKDISFNYGDVNYDAIVTVDCAELSQLGKLYEDNVALFTEIPIINIDHHISNTQFGKLNHIDVMASSSTQLLIPIIEALEADSGVKLMDEDVATLLLAGLITDTGSFQNANTTPKSFAVAAKLVSHGARQQEIIRHIYKTKELSMLKLWGRVLSKIQTDDQYRMVWSTVSQQDVQDTHSKIDQTGDIIDELMSNAPGAEFIVLVKEKGNGVISGSIRTTTASADASYIAEQFGGGGHVQAAGFTLQNTTLQKVEGEVVEAVRKYQAERLNIVTDDETEEIKPKEQMQEVPIVQVEATKEKSDAKGPVLKVKI